MSAIGPVPEGYEVLKAGDIIASELDVIPEGFRKLEQVVMPLTKQYEQWGEFQ